MYDRDFFLRDEIVELLCEALLAHRHERGVDLGILDAILRERALEHRRDARIMDPPESADQSRACARRGRLLELSVEGRCRRGAAPAERLDRGLDVTTLGDHLGERGLTTACAFAIAVHRELADRERAVIAAVGALDHHAHATVDGLRELDALGTLDVGKLDVERCLRADHGDASGSFGTLERRRDEPHLVRLRIRGARLEREELAFADRGQLFAPRSRGLAVFELGRDRERTRILRTDLVGGFAGLIEQRGDRGLSIRLRDEHRGGVGDIDRELREPLELLAVPALGEQVRRLAVAAVKARTQLVAIDAIRGGCDRDTVVAIGRDWPGRLAQDLDPDAAAKLVDRGLVVARGGVMRRDHRRTTHVRRDELGGDRLGAQREYAACHALDHEVAGWLDRSLVDLAIAIDILLEVRERGRSRGASEQNDADPMNRSHAGDNTAHGRQTPRRSRDCGVLACARCFARLITRSSFHRS